MPRDYDIVGKNDLDVPSRRLLEDGPGRCDQVLFDRRLTDCSRQSLKEREGHTAADQEAVHSRDEVLDEPELVERSGTAQDQGHRALRVFQQPGEREELTLHEKADGGRLEEARDGGYGRVRTMAGREGIVDVTGPEMC